MIEVIVTVKGTQRDAQGEQSELALMTTGRCYEKNGTIYILYEDSEVSGMEGTRTMLKVYPNHVVLVRRGAVEQSQEFILGERRRSPYKTPYGTLQLEIVTTKLTNALEALTGEITIEYEVAVNGQWQSANTLSVSVRKEQKRGH